MSDIQSNVDHIIKTLADGPDETELNIDDQPVNAFDYLQDALDIEYIVNSKGQYLGARVLVAFGGPNIWINTRTKQVEGHWWGDSCIKSYSQDNWDLDAALEELWNCR